MESRETQYVELSTYGQTVKICKIFVKTPYDENLKYLLSNTFLKLVSAILLTFSRFSIFSMLRKVSTLSSCGKTQLEE